MKVSPFLFVLVVGLSLHQPLRPVGLLADDATRRPNIVLMMADDMGMGDTSAYQDFTGNGDAVQVHTPQMERLARMGVRMTDAHTPSSRCSPTRYGLLTGRYPWRNRLKYWVLFGAQGDPMIEADRPTIASMLRDQGYSTGLVGKWHVGLRYRRSDGSPAAQWSDADLRQPLFTTPLDHGFDFARFTSRSHGTSGPDAGAKKAKKPNGPRQSVGPGHIHGRTAIAATANGKQLATDGPAAYVLSELGSRHSDHAIEFLQRQTRPGRGSSKPFFLYYPSNSNHGPYTPDQSIDGKPVAGAARTKSGDPMDARHDFIYENDVALGRLLDWLERTDDPRDAGRKMIETTLVIFTSDNGAEKNSDIATGPFRSHKGSVYEGGHRVPFIAAWAAGGIGDGDATTPGRTSDQPIGLQDLYATVAEIVGTDLPDLRRGEKGAEDSFSVLAALRGESIAGRPPLFFNDHKEAKADPAAVAMRLDSPTIDGTTYDGQWKLFFDARLLRAGQAHPYELYNLAVDQWETNDRIADQTLQPLIHSMAEQALLHRNAGGHRMVPIATTKRTTIDLHADGAVARQVDGKSVAETVVNVGDAPLTMVMEAVVGKQAVAEPAFRAGAVGLGIRGGRPGKVDQHEAIEIRFDRDVIVESAAIVAGQDGVCGGFYRVGEGAPLAIYCVDADLDAKDQSGLLSDIGVLQAGATLRLDSSPHFGVEAAGSWSLQNLTLRLIEP
ncbi:arylsulfatase [Stieleria sp. ICT_E10.1]|uniref:sulfatase family protein n=1 Tax=Stieleria sedimenti TaxID=2976331 RepID=UPI00217F727E|nr:arylsulfatase [Stieleria sedimenti]MCS7465973.1 arylsulfatase [Stieleria sedimenti]